MIDVTREVIDSRIPAGERIDRRRMIEIDQPSEMVEAWEDSGGPYYYHESAMREMVKVLERIANEAKMWGGDNTDLGSLASEAHTLLTHYKELLSE